MDVFICKRCHHESTTKSNLLSHLRRKKPCQTLHDTIDISDYIEELLTVQQEPKRYSCLHCNYQFNTRQSKSRHLKTCKKIKSNETQNAEVIISKLQEENKLLNERLEKVEQQIQSNHTAKIINNTQININMNINTFGQEDLSYLTHDFLSYCLLNPRKGMTSLIENIHYNKEHPYNQNLRCKSLKQNIFEKYVDSEWRACDASNTLDELIRKGYRILNAHYTVNFMNDPLLLEDETRQRAYERFRFLSDTSCNDYFAVKRELRVLVKDRTMYLIASPDDNIVNN